jgi:hypothetical protein
MLADFHPLKMTENFQRFVTCLDPVVAAYEFAAEIWTWKSV